MILVLVDLAGALAAAVLAALLAVHVGLAWRAHGRVAGLLVPPAPLAGADLPPLLVQIPVYNEAEAVSGAIAAAAAFDWPRERLTIQILDDSDDGSAAPAGAAIRRLAAAGLDIRHLVRTTREGFKAGALAAGLAQCEAPFVALLDADFRAPPDWPRRALALLLADERAAFAQFRFEFANRDANWLTRVQQLAADAHFLCEQPGRLASGGPIQFNGTAGVWRRAAILDAGGWSGDTLAEDLDLALQAQAKGWRAALALAPAIPCEAPESAAAWRGQQRRWSQGFAAVARRALAPIRQAPWPAAGKVTALQLVALQAAFPCLALAAAAFAGDLLLRGWTGGHARVLGAAAAAAVAGAVAVTWPAWRALRRGSLVRYAATLAALAPCFAALAVANSAAIVAAALGQRTPIFLRTPKSGRL